MTPPRLARWLLERTFDADTAEALVGDLTEEFQRRADERRPIAAWWGFWRHALTSIVTSRWARRPDGSLPVESGRKAGIVDGFRQDLRFAIRSLSGAPTFAVAAIATLAIGIGASTAIGTAASRALFRPLPYPTGDRLVFLGHPNPDGTVGNVGFTTVVDWRARLSRFDELAMIRGWTPTVVADEGAARLNGMKVSWNYFRMLGVRPALGRDFTEADDNPDHWRVVIISDALWRRQFHARPDIPFSVSFFGRPYQIVGVMSPSFEPLISEHFVERADVWAPLGYNLAGDSSCRSCQHLKLVGRLRDGATLPQALAELAVVHADLRREHPSDYTEPSPVALMLQDELTRPIRRPLQVLLGTVLFVLLVASANVAGLILSRAPDRAREFALRAALGAGRARLVRQLLTESVVLVTAGAMLGILLARWGLALLAEYAPVTVPRLDHAPADPTLFLVGLAAAAVSLAAFGLLPALTSARTSLESVLRTVRVSASRGSIRAREWLMAGQVAVALLLVAGAGLMYRSVDRLLGVDPGFESRGVLSAGFSLVGAAWAEDAAVRTFQDELIRQVRSIPGVEHAALAGQIPLGDNYDRWGFHIEGRAYPSEADAPEAERYGVTPDYFQVMRIPLREGRAIAESDRTDSPLVIVINETAARTLWPGSSPIGSRVRIGGGKSPLRTVVGVVGDVRHYELGQPATPQMYVPQTQMTDSYLMLVVRTGKEPAALTQPIRESIRAIARDVPIYDVSTLDDRLRHSVASRTFLMLLLGLFAATTLVMAAVGLYGVVSQGVSTRRREFGIRLALGAARRDISTLVARRGLSFVAIGVLTGLAASTLLGQFLGSQLYETTPADAVTLTASAALLLVVAVLAHVAPIRRATGVNPAVTLRNE